MQKPSVVKIKAVLWKARIFYLMIAFILVLQSACGNTPTKMTVSPQQFTIVGEGNSRELKFEFYNKKGELIEYDGPIESYSTNPDTARLEGRSVIAGKRGHADFTVKAGKAGNWIQVDVKTQEEIDRKKEKDASARAWKAKVDSITQERLWNASKNKKICDRHPEWSREDCAQLASRGYWKGMGIAMLIESVGRAPDSRGTIQFEGRNVTKLCWSDTSPACFFDQDGDDKIDDWE